MKRPVQILLMMLALGVQSEHAQSRSQRTISETKVKLDATREAKRDAAVFPSHTLTEGVDYERLRGRALTETIAGTNIAPTIPSGAVAHQLFEIDGRYVLSSDHAFEAWGGYFVTNDMVATWIKVSNSYSRVSNFALYQSQSGKFMLAWLGRNQAPEFAEIRIDRKDR